MKYLFSLCIAVAGAAPAAAATTYVTDFTKTSNIYTNLNMRYPHTDDDTGVPGSRTGRPNASVFFAPPPTDPAGTGTINDVNNGIGFQLASDPDGHDFAEVGTASFGVPTISLPINVTNATNLYLLGASYTTATFNVTLTSSNGTVQTFSNILLPDFNGGGDYNENDASDGVTTQTVFRTTLGVGAGGTGNSSNGANNFYYLYETNLRLDPAFQGQTLVSATLTGNGFETLILGATVTSADSPTSGVPEPMTWAMMIVGFGAVGRSMRRRATQHSAGRCTPVSH